MVLVSLNKGVRTPGPALRANCGVCFAVYSVCWEPAVDRVRLAAWWESLWGTPKGAFVCTLGAHWNTVCWKSPTTALFCSCAAAHCSLWEVGGAAGRVGRKGWCRSFQDVIKCDFLKAPGRKEHFRANPPPQNQTALLFGSS